MSTSSSDELAKLFEQPLVHKPGEPASPTEASKEEDPPATKTS